MKPEETLQKKYLGKLKQRIPKNLIIEGISDKTIHIANEYLKSRKKLEFTFSEISSHFGKDWNYEEHPLGYIMKNTENNTIVGFLGTICSKRLINNNEVVCCNLVHWYVEKEFRIFAYAFFLPLLEKNIIVYATTPRNSILGLYKKLGFEVKVMKYSVGFSVNLASIFSKDYKRFSISDGIQDIENCLNNHDKKIYQDHKEYNCLHFVITDKENVLKPCYFIAKKSKRYHIGVLDILYISNIKEFNPYGPEIFTKISFYFNKIFTGQRYFSEEKKINYNPKFLSKTVDKFFPIKTFNNYNITDALYSDLVLFDA